MLTPLVSWLLSRLSVLMCVFHFSCPSLAEPGSDCSCVEGLSLKALAKEIVQGSRLNQHGSWICNSGKGGGTRGGLAIFLQHQAITGSAAINGQGYGTHKV